MTLASLHKISLKLKKRESRWIRQEISWKENSGRILIITYHGLLTVHMPVLPHCTVEGESCDGPGSGVCIKISSQFEPEDNPGNSTIVDQVSVPTSTNSGSCNLHCETSIVCLHSTESTGSFRTQSAASFF